MVYLGKGFSDQVMLLNSRELCKELIPTNTSFTLSQCLRWLFVIVSPRGIKGYDSSTAHNI